MFQEALVTLARLLNHSRSDVCKFEHGLATMLRVFQEENAEVLVQCCHCSPDALQLGEARKKELAKNKRMKWLKMGVGGVIAGMPYRFPVV